MAQARRRNSHHEETIQRNVAILSIAPRVSCNVRGEKHDPEPVREARPHLALRGELSEPLRGVLGIELKVWADPDTRTGSARPAAVGHIVGMRPHVEVLAAYSPIDFSYIWSLALSGRLTHAYLSFTKPHYNSATVLYMSFSNEREE